MTSNLYCAMTRLSITLIVVAAVASQARAQDRPPRSCGELLTGSEQKQCAEAEFRLAEAELGRALDRALGLAAKAETHAPHTANGQGTSLSAAILASQQAWQAYRDAECWGVVGRGGGSGRMVWVLGCLAEKNRQRALELNVPFFQR